jgi:hypothetical protein
MSRLLCLLLLASCAIPDVVPEQKYERKQWYRLPNSGCLVKKNKWQSGSNLNLKILNECSLGAVEFSAGDQIKYSLSDQKLLSFYADNEWGDIVRGITAWEGEFFTNGYPSRLVFRVPQRIQDTLWSTISFNEQGKLIQGTLAEDSLIGGFWLKAYSNVAFDPEGKYIFSSTTVLAKDQEIQGVLWSKNSAISLYQNGIIQSGVVSSQGATIKGLAVAGSSTVVFYEDGSVYTASLASTQTIKNASYEGDVEFSRTGTLVRGTLAETTTLNGVTFPAKIELHFSEEGKLLFAKKILQEDKQLETVLCRSNDTLYFGAGRWFCLATGTEPAFDESGKVAYIFLGQDQMMQGLLFGAGGALYFHPSGGVKNGILGAPSKIDGLTLPAGANVYLNEDGSLASAVAFLEKDLSVLGVNCTQDKFLYIYRSPALSAKSSLQAICSEQEGVVGFYDDGALNSLELEAPKNVLGVPCDVGVVTFFENGRISSATLSKATTIQGLLLQTQSQVYFHENGKLQEGALAEPQMIQKNLYEGEVYFHESGLLEGAILAKEATIDGKTYEAGTYLEFNESGKVISQ